MDDLISRKMAIGAIIDHIREKFAQRDTPLNYISGLYKAEDIIEILPSAQPKIVRCKDCVKREICRTSTVWAVSPGDNWYCADGERRTDE